MRRNYAKVYLHLVWATWDRRPLITPDIRLPLYQSLHEQATRSGCELIAVGGIEDHVHVLLKMPTTVTIAQVAQGLKGGSSHMVAQALRPGTFFKWQGSYGAFSVSRTHVPVVRNYVLNQERHHRENDLSPVLERMTEH